MYFVIWIILGLIYFCFNAIITLALASDEKLSKLTILVSMLFGLPILIIVLTVGVVAAVVVTIKEGVSGGR